ncbi:MAG: alpha-amylase family glycosyl hydrolase, partial [Clostridia bacterium]|nr:alpha-amylase family glycosyl hydrolase [Clostridia bacterium]
MKRAPSKKKYKILTIDPYLQPFADDISLRMNRNAEVRQKLLGDHADLSSFANGYLYYGIRRTEKGWIAREWAPGADEVHLIGDFNNWDRSSHPMKRLDSGVWEIELKGKNALLEGQAIKLQIRRGNQVFDRIPAYIRRTAFDPNARSLTGIVYDPERPYPWTDGGYGKRKLSSPLIYEAHVGMAQEYEGIGTYREFADNVIPRIVKDGYNCIQLMAIAAHPYYGSFGYQVTNFFAPSSWSGAPDDLKYLVNKAHEAGLFVLLDVVHSHACPNVGEGLNRFDGTENQYFLEGDRGNHPAWGTKPFDYGKHEVIHFLLSNLKYWLQDYHFDGFRLHGVTSM